MLKWFFPSLIEYVTDTFSAVKADIKMRIGPLFFWLEMTVRLLEQRLLWWEFLPTSCRRFTYTEFEETVGCICHEANNVSTTTKILFPWKALNDQKKVGTFG